MQVKCNLRYDNINVPTLTYLFTFEITKNNFLNFYTRTDHVLRTLVQYITSL